jgi:hypothetical protein
VAFDLSVVLYCSLGPQAKLMGSLSWHRWEELEGLDPEEGCLAPRPGGPLLVGDEE